MLRKLSGLMLALLLANPILQGAEPFTSPAVGQTIAPFELRDLTGEVRNIAPQPKSAGLVVFFIGTECPLVKLYATRMQELAQRFESQGLRFVALCANQHDSLTELQAFAREHALKLPILKDLGNKVADAFQAERTPEAFVLDAEFKVVYHGRIDDQYTYGIQRPKVQREYLVEAVEAVLKGKAVPVPATEPVGCHIGRVLKPDESSDVTYSKQIAAILQKSCVECHRTGEIGPFPLTTYDEVVGWAEMIDEVVQAGRMPPWHANPAHGKFSNDISLNADEKQLIYRWVAAGVPRGNPADLPQPRTFPEGWKIGEPDAVFAMSEKPFTVPASGEVRYQYFKVDPQFKEDKWIQAAECRPGNRSVVHHIIVGIEPPFGSRKSQGAVHSEWLTASAPGSRPLQLPPGYAKFVPAGSKLVFQMHFTPNGKPATDISRVGFRFADPATIRKQVGTDKAANALFTIPPHAEKHPVRGVKQIEHDTLLLTMFPHMHLRGCSFRYTLKLLDGSEEILLDIPHYDFNWQNGYELAEPRLLPAGSKIICDATFNNSASNLANPDPTARVRWGDQTWEEMMIGYFDMALADQDLTLPQRRRTEQFVVRALAGNVSLPSQLEKLAPSATASTKNFEAFAVTLRETFPQLDRVCWTTVASGKLTVERTAQEAEFQTALAAAREGRKVNAQLSKLASYAGQAKIEVHRDLSEATPFDLRYMGQKFASSVHVPVQINGRPGTLNFWSTEKDAFPTAASELLEQATKLLARPTP